MAILLATAGHQNPLWSELRSQGIDVGAGYRIPLPAEKMPDGLAKAAQRKVIEQLIGPDEPIEEYIRPSVVARYLLEIKNLEPSDPKAPARGVDFYFVAYGRLDDLARKDFLDSLLKGNQQQGSAGTITKADLAGRGIRIPPEDQPHEGYGIVDTDLFDRVRLRLTGRSYWSRTAGSVLLAGKIDERFNRDPKYPNQWRPLSRNDDGELTPGPPRPYSGGAYYLKFTRLAEPEGALFGEGHIVFTEPHAWFEGANLLRSKLPPIIENQVREIRRLLLKAKGP